jgi:hypothetical protein
MISVTEPSLRCEADRLNYQAEWIKVGLGEISVAREAELAHHCDGQSRAVRFACGGSPPNKGVNRSRVFGLLMASASLSVRLSTRPGYAGR